ncbi:MAG: HesA/MoeB/ThiF family protein [Proteobacteria bacterium]|nr:HesA/MoeB/ThiF family protein [Pseudomonadota bacterium]
MALSEREQNRYHRQMIFPDWGEEAQLRLKNSRVLIAGAGGLGSPVSIYLAVAGVGTIRICDCGTLELSNLNRQILHDDSRIGKNKAVSARETLSRLNPEITVEPVTEELSQANVQAAVGHVDLIVDCLDNFETRQLLNSYAVKNRIPMVHAGVYGMRGQLTFIQSPETPCLWCIHSGTIPKVLFPIVGATAGVIGCLEALEAIKYLSGIGTNLRGRLLIWDGFTMEFTELPQKKMPDCPVCGKK